MSRNSASGCGGPGGPAREPGRRTRVGTLLFPREPRSFPGRRGLKISLRAAHVLCSGVAVGSLWLEAAEPLRSQWMLASAFTGLAMLALDLHESGVFLVQARGLVVLIKVGLLGALRWLGPWQGWALAALMVVSVLSSHASSRIRYFVVFGRGRLKGAETKG
jgi:hypothetical protein